MTPSHPLPGVLLIGCGRMGGALLSAWRGGWRELYVLDPNAPTQDGAAALSRAADIAGLPRPLIVVLAVKPAMVESVGRDIAPFCGPGVIGVSIAAGISLDSLSRALSPMADIVRAMPNTAVHAKAGATALIGAKSASDQAVEACAQLFGAAGQVVRLDREDQMDAATAVSGSGPAYFFAFTEALARAGIGLGLSPDVAEALARQTLVGAGALAAAREASLAELRIEVTSPGGTTAAALDRFAAGDDLPNLVARAVGAAATRSAQLGVAPPSTQVQDQRP